MTANEIRLLEAITLLKDNVKAARKAQKMYFYSRDKNDLIIAKELEKKVDDTVAVTEVLIKSFNEPNPNNN